MRHIYKEIYSYPVKTGVGQIVNLSTPVFFGGYSRLIGREVNALAISTTAQGSALASYLITLVDVFGNQLLYNYPAYDLQQAPEDGANIPQRNSILRLTSLKDIDLKQSFFVSSVAVGYVSETTIFTIHFYT